MPIPHVIDLYNRARGGTPVCRRLIRFDRIARMGRQKKKSQACEQVGLRSLDELRARRAETRRRRRRRRVHVALAVMALVLTLSGVVFVLHTGPRTRPRPWQLASLIPGAAAAHREPSRPQPVKPSMLALSAVTDAGVDRLLHHTSYVRLAGSVRREVAFTFDDGPGPYTPRILRILRRLHAPATFFVIGRWTRVYPKLVAEEARDGFEIGDHTENHPFMALLPPDRQQSEIVQAADAIRAAGAPYPRLWRPPYGSFDAATLQICTGWGC